MTAVDADLGERSGLLWPASVEASPRTLDPLSFLVKFIDNPLRVIPQRAYYEKIVHQTGRFGGVAWILNQQIRRGDASQVMDLLPELSEFVLSPYHGVAQLGSQPGGESDSTVTDSNT